MNRKIHVLAVALVAFFGVAGHAAAQTYCGFHGLAPEDWTAGKFFGRYQPYESEYAWQMRYERSDWAPADLWLEFEGPLPGAGEFRFGGLKPAFSLRYRFLNPSTRLNYLECTGGVVQGSVIQPANYGHEVMALVGLDNLAGPEGWWGERKRLLGGIAFAFTTPDRVPSKQFAFSSLLGELLLMEELFRNHVRLEFGANVSHPLRTNDADQVVTHNGRRIPLYIERDDDDVYRVGFADNGLTAYGARFKPCLQVPFYPAEWLVVPRVCGFIDYRGQEDLGHLWRAGPTFSVTIGTPYRDWFITPEVEWSRWHDGTQEFFWVETAGPINTFGSRMPDNFWIFVLAITYSP